MIVFTYFLLFPSGRIISIIPAITIARIIPCAHVFKKFIKFFTYLYIIPVLEIFIHIESPTINSTDTKNIIPKSNLNVPPICSNNDTILLSASGSHIADANLYITVRTDNFIIGTAHIPIIIIMPTIPKEFFKREVAPNYHVG